MKQREEIIHQSYHLFLRNGIKSMSMDDLSRNMGKSKKTLYKYFRNKQDLVNQVMSYFVEQQKEMLLNFQKNAPNAIIEMARVYEYTVNSFTDIKPTIIFDLQKYYPESWKVFQDYKQHFILGTIKSNIQKGMEQGLYRKDLNADIIATYYTIRSDEVRNPDFFPPSIYPFNKVMKEVFIYHIRGLATLKGMEYLENELEISF